MTRLVQAILLMVVGLMAVGAVAPALARLAGALTPLVLVIGIVAAVLQLVRYFTRNR
jgi:hypothetical protein